MTASVQEARHLVELGNLQTILHAMDYHTQLIEKSAQIPYATLLARVELPNQLPPVELGLTFYPVGENELAHSMLLQYFIELPFQMDAQALRQVKELLPDLNKRTVVGHFGISGERNAVHYRYVQALPVANPITREAVADVIILVVFTPALFWEILEGVVAQRISVAEASVQVAAR
jgi:hypothetical protein